MFQVIIIPSSISECNAWVESDSYFSQNEYGRKHEHLNAEERDIVHDLQRTKRNAPLCYKGYYLSIRPMNELSFGGTNHTRGSD